MTHMLRIGIDTGGTFTDLVLQAPDGPLRSAKLASTPHDPAQAVLVGLKRLLGDAPAAGLEIIHGTTVATNALLTRTGGPTAFVTSRGFEDLLILGRQARPRLYALTPEVPPPLCRDEHCLGVDERVAAGGRVLRAPTPEELARLAGQVRELGVASVAVALLHSYANPAHELQVADALAPLGLPVSLSHRVLPAHREYERAQATVVDAYVAPQVAGYLRRLQEAVQRQGPSRIRVMQQSGGAIALAEAAAEPVRTVLSGPAAGAIGAQAVARQSGVRRLITFDMGGTSTDVSLIDGEPLATTEASIAGLPLQLPMLAVHTVGAGGGSLVWVDAGGALRVGPASAGAVPGPACYGTGGQAATLTDADLILGTLVPARFLGGQLRLSRALAERALGPIAERLGLPLLDTAAGVAQVAAAVVARAIRVISVERGHDPGEFALLPFGGAGALHAPEVARELGMRHILVPPAPGLLSAYGALCADVVRERARTLLRPAGPAQADGSVAAVLTDLLGQVEADLRREGAGGAGFQWYADLRFAGQSYELTLSGPMGQMPDLAAEFRAEHQRRYGFTLDGAGELVALRVRGTAEVPQVAPAQLGALSAAAPDRVLGQVEMACLDGSQLRLLRTPVLDRAALVPGETLPGPALIAEYSATTVVPPDWQATVDGIGALHLRV